MKSLKLFLLALLFVLGAVSQSFAIAIPEAEDAANGPALWIIPVVSGESSATMDVGNVACWDIGASTGDNDNRVKDCAAVDTYTVAGVIYGLDITPGNIGLMVVHGVTQVDVLSGNNTDGGLSCSSGTAGSAKTCDTLAASFGIVTAVNSTTSAQVYVRGLQ